MKASAGFLVLPLAIGALVVGCGGSDSDNSSDNPDTATQTEKPASGDTANGGNTASTGKTEVLQLAADPGGALAYDPSDLSAKSGQVEIDFTNDSPLAHDVVVEDSNGNEVAATPTFTGGSKTTEFDAKPGTYTFYCSVPGHEAGGMKGTLTVK